MGAGDGSVGSVGSGHHGHTTFIVNGGRSHVALASDDASDEGR